MRHRVESSRFGRTMAHRQALLAGLVGNFIAEKRIITTLPKAKAARCLAEKMVTLAKRKTLAARRRVLAVLHQKPTVKVLFDEIAPQYQDRAGGYVRIMKLYRRRSDSSVMAVMEWVGINPVDKKKKHAPTAEEPQKKSG